MLPLLSDFTFTFCQVGLGKIVLTPPPVDPPPFPVRRPGDSHHVTSSTALPDAFSIVPPTLSTNGLTLGKSTCAFPSLIWSPDPSSPDEMHVVIPSNRAAFSRSLIAETALLDHPGSSSANPQLIESTTGIALITSFSKSTQPF